MATGSGAMADTGPASEDPFELIRKGNAFEASSDHWRSAEFYSRASICLRCRADNLSSQIREQEEVDAGARAEKRKVVSLFRAQSLEYLYKARHCLLEALRFENDQDRTRTLEVAKTGTGSLDPLFSMLTPEESEKRNFIFEKIFSGIGKTLHCKTDAAEVETEADAQKDEPRGKAIGESETGDNSPPAIPANENDDKAATNLHGIDNRRQSIESRLAELDSSLLPKIPPPFVSGSRSSGGDGNQNRLEEIKRGLGRLGVSLPDDGKKSDFIPDNISAEDQVNLILQQAKDEARVERGLHIEGRGEADGPLDTEEYNDDAIDENDSMFDGFEDDEVDIDALLAKAENLVTKSGCDADGGGKSSLELVEIRKVQGILLQARLCLEMGPTKSSDEKKTPGNSNKIDDDGTGGTDDDASENSVDSDHSAGESHFAARKMAREHIENAHKSIDKLLKGWD